MFSAESPLANVDAHVTETSPFAHFRRGASPALDAHGDPIPAPKYVTIAHTIVRPTEPRTCIVPTITKSYAAGSDEFKALPATRDEVLPHGADPDAEVVFDFDKEKIATFVLARATRAEAAAFFDVAEGSEGYDNFVAWHDKMQGRD